jgi:hypothetical protein
MPVPSLLKWFAFVFWVATALHSPAQAPPDSARIQPIPLASTHGGQFQLAGLQPGEPAPDLTLYTPSGQGYTLSHLLAQGKPVALVSGSRTCPVFRQNLPHLAEWAARVADSAWVLVVYVVEAHPAHGQACPYTGRPWLTAENEREGVLHPQPETYGQRRALAQAVLAAHPLPCPLVLDGPTNTFWLTYGQAPNSLWWVGTDGRIAARQAWFPFPPQ